MLAFGKHPSSRHYRKPHVYSCSVVEQFRQMKRVGKLVEEGEVGYREEIRRREAATGNDPQVGTGENK